MEDPTPKGSQEPPIPGEGRGLRSVLPGLGVPTRRASRRGHMKGSLGPAHLWGLWWMCPGPTLPASVEAEPPVLEELVGVAGGLV